MEPSQQQQQQPLPQQPPLPPQQPHPQHHVLQSLLHHHHPPPSTLPMRSASSTPMSSPGLFSPSSSRHNFNLPPTSVSESSTPAPLFSSPFLHPLQTHRVRETHKALIDSDNINGRKSINQYEVIEEIGRGMHGKVKLARNLETSDNVAIKIIPRFSKKRRLGKVTMSPQDKTKKEIAILKKIRHPNVVALLEVIDDPELKKIYMVLEHVELGEIVWRKKGLPHVCQHERRRIEREMRGDPPSAEEQQYDQILERRQAIKDLKRAKMARQFAGPSDYWSVEHGAADEASSVGHWSRISSRDDFGAADIASSVPGSRRSSTGPSRSHSVASSRGAPAELEQEVDWEEDLETPGPHMSGANSATALDGTMYGAYVDEGTSYKSTGFRGRSPSMADSIISHMSSVDYNPRAHDPFADDFSYVPCFSFEKARSAFRDTVLGLEYLHYQGVVHRDIKPANLLWSREHRVKISDFGVSYFGRPIREGEPDDVSESEARDFDDDLELAKTVGTPAFFAPELCYTDLDKEQPKVSEQVDVWSLGVTLYCLIYARIPFLAEDEFQMFRKIATEDVHIPRRRLKPVDPSTPPNSTSLYKRQNTAPYRDDNDLEYEEVDNLLFDLLRQMLTKNPEKRIRLRDIKRHPWVVQGITNPVGWLDDTDPARPSCGRKIQVDEREMSSAVVPLTFLERARSVVKKAVGKVIHPLVERSDSKSRKRATSSAASSAGDSMFRNGPTTPQYKGERRASMRPDDYFANAARDGASSTESFSHASMIANPPAETMVYDPMATVLPSLDGKMDIGREDQAASARLSHHGRSLSRLSQQFLNLAPPPASESQTTPTTPYYQGHNGGLWDGPAGILRMTEGPESKDDMARSYSVDRGLFANTDKRAQAQVAVNTTVAPGNIHGPRHPIPMRSVDLGRNRLGYSTPSPLSSSPQSATRYQHSQPQSDPNFHNRQHPRVSERPQTAHLGQSVSDVQPELPAISASPESYADAIVKPKSESIHTLRDVEPADIPCPPSPTGEWSEHCENPFRGDTMTTAKSSSTDSIGGMGTPLTSPSETTSPVSSFPPAKATSQKMLAFQSDPSLPALLSGASSISADLEGELLGKPGVVSNPASLLETTESLTPPAMAKEPTAGFPIDQVFGHPPAMESGTLKLHLEATRPRTPVVKEPAPRSVGALFDDEDNSDDDDILLMAKSKKKPASKPPSPTSSDSRTRTPRMEARRRDTNVSTASNETAKKVPMHDEASFSLD